MSGGNDIDQQQLSGIGIRLLNDKVQLSPSDSGENGGSAGVIYEEVSMTGFWAISSGHRLGRTVKATTPAYG